MTEKAERVTELKMITLDCADVRAETGFWAELLGWEVAVVTDDYGMLTRDGAPALGFGRVVDHEPPTWPDERGRKQFHLDLACDDIAAEAQRAQSLGARVPDEQPGETWRVVLSPAGHPFCLTAAANW